MIVYKNLIFDGDNTLWECSKYYQQQKREFGVWASKRSGFDPKFCETLLEKIDVEFTTTPEAFGRDRYPRAFSATSAVLDTMKGKEVDKDAAKEAYAIGDAVFSAEYALYEGVKKMLHKFQAEGRQLFLYSKGDLEVQQRKIDINGMKQYFPQFRCYLVLKKSPQVLQQILSDHNLKKSETLVIGDSLRDEISCATKCGVHSLLVQTGDKWGYENVNVSATYELDKDKTAANLITWLPMIEEQIEFYDNLAVSENLKHVKV